MDTSLDVFLAEDETFFFEEEDLFFFELDFLGVFEVDRLGVFCKQVHIKYMSTEARTRMIPM